MFWLGAACRDKVAQGSIGMAERVDDCTGAAGSPQCPWLRRAPGKQKPEARYVLIWPVMAGVGPAVSERIVLFRHGPVTFGVSVIGTAVKDCIG